MIEERYCSYEVARLLKEKGFNEKCIGYYVDYKPDDVQYSFLEETNSTWEPRCCSAPTHQMACDWLMEKDIYISPKYCCFQRCKKNDKPCCKWEPTILSLTSSLPLYPQPLDMCKYYDTFGEAVEAALKYVLENLV